MNKNFRTLFLSFSILVSLTLMVATRPPSAQAQDIFTPTPTYDPLEEPPIPENPSDYELGRNWYWHYCMPCHGDKGQGLTDEWRAVWEPDHQDCWGKGCHAGKSFDDSFTIPTVVPPVVTGGKLARFSSLQALDEYLKTTHPPQNPSELEDQQYQAIALYLFHENDRPLVEPTLTATLTPIPTSTPLPIHTSAEENAQKPGLLLYGGLGIVLVVLAIWAIRKRL